MITNSLKTLPEITQRTYLALPKAPQFQNYTTALFGSRDFLIPMMKPIINSTIITLSVTLLAAFFGGLGGYYLSAPRAHFTRIIFILVGIALYLPYQAVIIPLTTITAKTGLINIASGADPVLPDHQRAAGFGADGHLLPGHPAGAGRGCRSGWRLQAPDILQDRGPDLAAGLCLGGDHHLHPGLE